jgi:hypothetical protein
MTPRHTPSPAAPRRSSLAHPRTAPWASLPYLEWSLGAVMLVMLGLAQ